MYVLCVKKYLPLPYQMIPGGGGGEKNMQSGQFICKNEKKEVERGKENKK
jgi:hypothetical protein